MPNTSHFCNKELAHLKSSMSTQVKMANKIKLSESLYILTKKKCPVEQNKLQKIRTSVSRQRNALQLSSEYLHRVTTVNKGFKNKMLLQIKDIVTLFSFHLTPFSLCGGSLSYISVNHLHTILICDQQMAKNH